MTFEFFEICHQEGKSLGCGAEEDRPTRAQRRCGPKKTQRYDHSNWRIVWRSVGAISRCHAISCSPFKQQLQRIQNPSVTTSTTRFPWLDFSLFFTQIEQLLNYLRLVIVILLMCISLKMSSNALTTHHVNYLYQ